MTTTEAIDSFVSSKERNFVISSEEAKKRNDEDRTSKNEINENQAENATIGALRLLQYDKTRKMECTLIRLSYGI